MKLQFIKGSFILLFIIVLLNLTVKPVGAQYEKVVSAAQPLMAGTVLTITGGIIEPVWIRWQDSKGNVRFTLSKADGTYEFRPWADTSNGKGLTQTDRDNQLNKWIDTDFDGTVDSKMASVVEDKYRRGEGFGCIENPHTVTAVKPFNWAGSFSTITTNNISNDPEKLAFEPIYYTPGPNSASCVGNLTVSKSTVSPGEEFTASITMRNDTPYTYWTEYNNYRLGRWDGNGSQGWLFPPSQNQDRVFLPNDVGGGSTVTFSNFRVIAPNNPGTKDLQVRMVQDGREWFGQICSKTMTVVSLASDPSIQGINVANTGGGGAAAKTSGIVSGSEGAGYYNPMLVTLNANPGKNSDGSEASATYYVFFYKQSTGRITSDFINSATNKLADPTNGVLLVYDKTNNRCGGSHCVFDPVANKWQNLSVGDYGSIGYDIGDYMVVYPGTKQNFSAEKQWRVSFDKRFGSKSMYTAGYVFDSNGRSAITANGDITPSTP